MNEQSDAQLLRAYAETRSEAAFAELVNRQVDFVYSAAMRMVCDPHLAEDVTQGVFVALAKNAAQLSQRTVLSGWLHRTARNIGAQAVRTIERRRAREKEAAAMNELFSTETAVSWERIAPDLDAALDELSEPDRDAVLLRYFEKKSAHEMARQLNISEEAAQKRVSRAIDRLREFLARRGVTVSASGLTAVICGNAVQASPAGLALGISTAIASAATGATFLTTTTVAATKAIAMTTLQKTVIASTIAVLAATGVYEARQAAQLRKQVVSLQQHVELLTARNNAAGPPAVVPAVVQSEIAPPAQPTDAATEWAARLRALNTGDWRQAFAVGQQLAAMPPDSGLAILQNNWRTIENVSARQQLIKAFKFARHERLPAVLELGLLDDSTEVQSWALTYLKDVALQNFQANYPAARDWLAARKDWTLSQAFGDAIAQAANTLPTATRDQLLAQLKLFEGAGELFAQFPQAIAPSGLDQLLGSIAGGSDDEAAVLALRSARQMPFAENWYHAFVLPLLTADDSKGWAVKAAAARALATTRSEWALVPILETLTKNIYATKSHSSGGANKSFVWDLASALAEHGSPKAIPTMIALIEAENSYNTIYGVGYYGLGKMTGVPYDEKHDGKWWRQWWEQNRERFPVDARTLEIPRLEPIRQAGTAP